MPVEARYIAKVFENPPRIVVAAFPDVPPELITKALNDVSKKFPSSVEPAAIAIFPIGAVGSVDGVVGAITFHTSPSRDQLEKALVDVKNALVNQNFDIDE